MVTHLLMGYAVDGGAATVDRLRDRRFSIRDHTDARARRPTHPSILKPCSKRKWSMRLSAESRQRRFGV
jgi:hypothetical protein